ncbi:DUF2512 family protein [Desmospora profundinema]|uniref:DUF2512 family protein n=1 Tax=Desmospora profundinema TaxID=1571184 RepID=A0ABU1IPZ7_9BACL|nr:DUF2512 family protein [Desmospora profundinema]MDR6226791.1 hypothetical protein [Desmospora profundinema]
MKHLYALAFKLIVAFVSMWIFLGWLANWSLVDILWVSLLWAGSSYVIGDLWILPHVNNTVATLLDTGLAFALISFVGILLFGMEFTWINTSLLLAPSVFIGAGEWVLHTNMQREIFHKPL